MLEKKSPSTLVIGLALFSMFFGSGNLIFPLFLGAKYQGYFWLSALGFVMSAVILPTLGIFAMIPASGRYEKLFDGLLTKKYYKYIFLLILIFWIPLGSGPRCVLLAHASLSGLMLGESPLWLFSAIFLSLVYFCVHNRKRVIDILGKILTPLLLLSIFCIVIASLSHGDLDMPDFDFVKIFFSSMIEGYYTQDLIAAIFFSSALVNMLNTSFADKKQVLEKTLGAGLIAVSLLAVLYTALMAASAIHGEHLQGLSGDRLVSTLANIALGPVFGGLSSVAVSLACFTTEIALVLVLADFLADNFFNKSHKGRAIWVTLFIVWLMSLIRFDGVMALVAPAMQLIYPILVFLVLRLLWRSRTGFKHE